MSDEDALLAAIAAHPDEDTPRLAYADWLDEHDRPIRAEFIRVQIDISRKETLPRALQNRYVDVWKRNQELLDHHRDELLGSLATLPADTRIEFRRGFLVEMTLSAEQFVRCAEAIAVLKPLPDVAVWDAAAQLDALAEQSHHLALVTHLHMQSGRLSARVPLTPAEVWNVFVECWPWDRLRELNLDNCQIGDEGFERLAASENLSLVTALDLSENDLTDVTVVNLLRSRFPSQLKWLVLGGNPIGNQGAIELADRWPNGVADKLEHLNLRFTDIGQPGQQALLARFGGRVDLF
jgi:uncharacterized protein (TIGR02996 family)